MLDYLKFKLGIYKNIWYMNKSNQLCWIIKNDTYKKMSKQNYVRIFYIWVSKLSAKVKVKINKYLLH